MEGHISPLEIRREVHLLLFMHKQQQKKELIKVKRVNTRLHQGTVFNTYKPNNEKVKLNSLYRGAMVWNGLSSEHRNQEFPSFKIWLKNTRYN